MTKVSDILEAIWLAPEDVTLAEILQIFPEVPPSYSAALDSPIGGCWQDCSHRQWPRRCSCSPNHLYDSPSQRQYS